MTGTASGAATVGFDHRDAFRLARELRAAGLAADGAFRAAAAGPCGRLGVSAAALSLYVRRAWAEVDAGPQTDAMARAMAAADAGPAVATLTSVVAAALDDPDPPAVAVRVLALAFHLGRRAGPGAMFPFGSARIAEWAEFHRNTIDDCVAVLEDVGLLAVLRHPKTGRTVSDGRTGKARMVKYTGPELEGLSDG